SRASIRTRSTTGRLLVPDAARSTRRYSLHIATTTSELNQGPARTPRFDRHRFWVWLRDRERRVRGDGRLGAWRNGPRTPRPCAPSEIVHSHSSHVGRVAVGRDIAVCCGQWYPGPHLSEPGDRGSRAR